MNMRAHFAYAQARCQARFASYLRHPGSMSDTRAATQDTHVSPLQVPIESALVELRHTDDLHALDRVTRTLFRQFVSDAANWSPPEWRAAIRWTAILVELPAIQYVADGSDSYAWFQEDERMATFQEVLRQREVTPPELREWSQLLKQRIPGEALVDTWRRCWRRLWPSGERRARRQLLRLEGLILRSRQRLAQPDMMIAGEETDQLEKRLLGAFRNLLQTPTAIFAYLGLTWLMLARLRAGSIVRQLVPDSS